MDWIKIDKRNRRIMKTVTKTFNIYEFDELDENAQGIAITDLINFEIEVMNEDSRYYHCVI